MDGVAQRTRIAGETMRVCVVGGIFERAADYRARHALTPETILVDGLRSRGLDVSAVGHSSFRAPAGYDVVHVHHFGRAAMLMAALSGRVPFVFTGHAGALLCGYDRSRARRLAFAYVARNADALVALSEAEERFLRRQRGAGGAVVYRIPNGIPAETFPLREPDENERCAQPRQILYVGQLVQLKGVDVLLSSLREVVRHHNVHLVLAYQNGALEAEYKQLAVDLQVAGSVSFIGLVTPAALSRLYRASELVVLPSFAESLPSVVTEALLSGTPVVASRVGGIPDQVGEFGRVVEPGDVRQLAYAMRDVLERSGWFRARAADMREYAMRRFGVTSMVDRHVAAYESVCTVGARRPGLGRSFSHVPALMATELYWSRWKHAQAVQP
jgi:glycosyltransferase involved in cell wall biosynthesis